MGSYRRPHELPEALDLLAQGSWQVMAGGTDVFPARAHRIAWGNPSEADWLDITAIPELRGITLSGNSWRIGAATSWAALRDADLPAGFDALREAARQVGGRQVQARGTIGGNLCNASPAADGVPPLLVLDAEVELASTRGRRRLKLGEFILGNRRTARAADELLVALHVPAARAEARSVFLKLGARSHLVISIAMVAADAEGRVAVGACSEVARLWDGTPLAPMDDVRGSAAYRHAAAAELVARAQARLAA
ncbi:FAD binding domain-containing protein [Roseococcus sp. SDR]|uniref:FAD binding domain-containing protein n=1 Tax=Roseococcus sp. SDR TaxID=2835532 RepID=UPI001BD19559|nr:FAD binding domain-containing protein [Roseococcus sp. SDR]MBS7790415.1 FAD binding domain-containing protein [Roseococcus sp. SDR]MBV1845729.1 FAD binding domain-containing protein [Roseococcus sp. SDR]